MQLAKIDIDILSPEDIIAMHLVSMTNALNESVGCILAENETMSVNDNY